MALIGRGYSCACAAYRLPTDTVNKVEKDLLELGSRPGLGELMDALTRVSSRVTVPA